LIAGPIKEIRMTTPSIRLFEPTAGSKEPYGAKARIGLIALSTDAAIERDFARMVPDDRLGIYTTRIRLDMPTNDKRFLAPALGIPLVIIGPGETGLSGAVDEHCHLVKLAISTRIYETVARHYLG
jgi:hypothetical protein